MASQTRLTYLTTTSFPSAKASSVQVMQMCQAFAQAGAMVKLVSRLSPNQSDVFAHYGVSRLFEFAPQPFPRVPRASDVFQLQTVLRQAGTDWLCYTRGRDLTAPLVALWRGARAMVEAHGRPLTLREKVMLTLIARHPRGRLLVISQPLQEIYQREYQLVAQVAPDGVDLQRFTPQLSKFEARQQLGLADGNWIVYVGGLYEGRGLETLFQGVAALPAQLLIVGGRDPVEVAKWQNIAQSYGATNAHFVGYQNPARVPLYLFAADVLAMPYSTKTLTPTGEDTTAWMSPLKLYEYLAAGRPIVASDLQALRKVLNHADNAWLVPPSEAQVLGEALQKLLSDTTLTQRLAATARATAEQNTWLARAKFILELC